jgi:hypothetical protein
VKHPVYRLMVRLLVAVLLFSMVAPGALAEPTTPVSPMAQDGRSTCPRNNGIRFTLNGRCVEVTESVTILNGRILLPMREILNMVGGDQVKVEWFQEWRTACGRSNSNMVCFPIDIPAMIHDGELIHIDQPAVINPPTRGRTKVPLRFLLERFGVRVDYNDGEKSVNLTVPEDLWAAKSVNQSCLLHGYGTGDACPANRFFIPFTYSQFAGTDPTLMPSLVSTAHLWATDNEFAGTVIGWANWAAMHAVVSGVAPRMDIAQGQTAANAGYAGLALTAVVVTAGVAYEVLPVAPWLANATTSLRDRLLQLAGRYENGWQEINSNGTTLRALVYQARISGQTIVYRAADRIWWIKEFVWNNVKFDGLEQEGQTVTFLEAKSGEQFLTQAARYFPSAASNWVADCVRQLERQISAAQAYGASNEVAVRIIWHVENEELLVLLNRAFSQAGLLTQQVPVYLEITPLH